MIHKRGDILFKILKKVYIAMKGHIRSSGAQQKVKCYHGHFVPDSKIVPNQCAPTMGGLLSIGVAATCISFL